MQLIVLTSLTMIAFASNSILARLAVEGAFIDPVSFAIIRVFAGAVTLSALVMARSGTLPLWSRERIVGASSLALYMIGFSVAYISLDAGLGALILFGVVQITMFAFAALTGAKPSLRQICGASIAFAGLLIALWPGAEHGANLFGAGAMILAGLGWAAYTISGKSANKPLAATAANFVLCLPVLLIVLIAFIEHASVWGIVLAGVSGSLTSGLGYALWYRVLPQMQQSVAAVVQLSVPIIAIIGGALLLGETVTSAVFFATLLVVCGIGFAVTTQSAQARRS